ncbi:MAG: ThuA domain-containing protein [Oscillospiraceae bacterium]|nr:ThuA domain-containing protein [Oscillospiraceae bacterium]
MAIKMRVLLICDDFWHPGQIPTDGVAPLAERGFQFDIITNDEDVKPEALEGYDVVILSKGDESARDNKVSWKTKALQQAFISYVENGGGLLVVHCGLVAGEQAEALHCLIGSRFDYHPQDCPVTVQPIKPHPIVAGVEMFCEVDEHYRLEILADDIDIFLASYSPPQGSEALYETEPYQNTKAWISAAGYVRTQGNGRVCVLTPGHHLAVWHNPQYQHILENALNWCAGSNLQ